MVRGVAVMEINYIEFFIRVLLSESFSDVSCSLESDLVKLSWEAVCGGCC